MSLSAVTLSVSTVWVRYRAVVFAADILLMAAAVAFLTVGSRLGAVTSASEGGLKKLCETAGSGN